jgi:hypothetical protein
MAWAMSDPEKQLKALDTILRPRYAEYVKEASGDLAFALWLALVDKHLSRLGVSHSDLADFNSRDAFEGGTSPKEGAQECLEGDDTYAMFMQGE